MLSEIIDWTWRSGQDTVGIVAIKTSEGKLKVYIGVAQGGTEQEDVQYIYENGARLTEAEAKVFFPQYEDMEYAP